MLTAGLIDVNNGALQSSFLDDTYQIVNGQALTTVKVRAALLDVTKDRQNKAMFLSIWISKFRSRVYPLAITPNDRFISLLSNRIQVQLLMRDDQFLIKVGESRKVGFLSLNRGWKQIRRSPCNVFVHVRSCACTQYSPCDLVYSWYPKFITITGK